MIKEILIIIFGFIILSNFISSIREGNTNKKCSKDECACAKAALYKAEQNDSVINEKLKDTKSFIDKKIKTVENHIKDLVKKQKKNTKENRDTAKTINDIGKEL